MSIYDSDKNRINHIEHKASYEFINIYDNSGDRGCCVFLAYKLLFRTFEFIYDLWTYFFYNYYLWVLQELLKMFKEKLY